MAEIDLDRGVIKRHHAKTGVDVYMYLDQPGVYLNAFGTEVSEELAKDAGYDTVRYGKQRLRGEMVAKAMSEIEDQLTAEPGEKKVVRERNGFKVVDIGMGRHTVEDPDGAQLNAVPLPQEQALLLLDKLVPAEKKTSAKEKARKEADPE